VGSLSSVTLIKDFIGATIFPAQNDNVTQTLRFADEEASAPFARALGLACPFSNHLHSRICMIGQAMPGKALRLKALADLKQICSQISNSL
jgi:hypothetical protein